MPVAYSYLRFSTPEQALGDSGRRQSEAARAYAEKHGLTLDTSLKDEGVSGFSGANRTDGALGRFLEAIRTGRVAKGSFLLVENLDRLSREAPLQSLTTMQRIVEAGVSVVTLTDGKIYSKKTLSQGFDLFQALFELQRAHHESARKSELVSKAWEQKRKLAIETGRAQTSRCPGWLSKVGHHYEIIPDRAVTVRDIFQRLSRGEGARKIAASLNERGEPTWGHTKHGGVRKWHASYIQKMMYGRAVLGDGQTKAGDMLRGYFPPVIEEDLYWSARAAAESRRTSGVRNRGKKVSNIAQGLCRCAACGGTVVYVDKGVRSSGPFLQCQGVTDGRRCTNRRKWPYANFERGIFFVIGQASRDRIVEALDPTATLRNDVVTAELKVEEARKRLDALVAMIDDEPSDHLKSELKRRDRALVDAQASLESVRTLIAKRMERQTTVPNYVDLMKRARGDLTDRLAIAQTLVDIVDVIEFSDARAEVKLKSGGTGLVMPFGEPRQRPNRGWFTDGRNKLAEGEWSRPLPGKRALATRRKNADA